MTPGKFNLTIIQGATYSQVFTFKPGGVLAVLTDYTAHAQIRSDTSSSVVLLDLTAANSRAIVDGALGTVTLSISAADTAAITWTDAVYDLILTAPDGTVTRLLEGSVSVDLSVTR